jgi:hypothetical protein
MSTLAKLRERHKDDSAVCALLDFVEAVGRICGGEDDDAGKVDDVNCEFDDLLQALSEAVPESEGE